MGVRVPSAREPTFRAAGSRGLASALCCGTLLGLPRAPSAASRSPFAVCAEVLPAAGAEQQAGAARRLVERFCQDVPAARLDPTHAELEALWQRCSRMRRGEVASALSDQLAGASSSHDWRAQVRALHLLVHMHSQGQAARATAQAVMQSSEELIRFLAKEARSECSEVAARAILISQLTEAHIADLGGLLYFTAEAPTTERSQPLKEEPPSVDLLSLSSAPAPAAAAAAAAAAAPPLVLDLLSLDDGLLFFDPGPAPAPAQPPRAPALAPTQRAPLAPLLLHEASAPSLPLQAAALPPHAPLAAPPAAAAKPQCFDIAGGDVGGENPELDGMFSFQRRQVVDIPLATDAYMREHFARPSDPFACVVEHVKRHL